jgi:hypothetical protein
MKRLLLLTLFIPSLVKSQSFKKEYEGIKHPEIKTELFKSSRRLQTAGGLLGVGGAMLAGGIVLSMDADKESKRTAAKIIAGSGGVFCLIGGIILSNAGESLMKIRKDKNQVAFTGSSIVYTF